MKQILFNPFDIGKWFVLGFTAWLATLASGSSQGTGGTGGTGDTAGALDDPQIVEEAFGEAKDWVMENWEWVVGVGVLIALIVVVVTVVVTWVQSRGKFMLLDNVVNNRALVGQPWKEFRSEGNSLFLWSLVFSLIAFLVFGGSIGGLGWLIYLQLNANDFIWTGPLIGYGAGFVGLLFLLGIGFAYITRLLEDFVIPLMYQRRLKTTEAWRVFLSLHSQNVGSFIAYFLWVALLGLAWGIAIFAFVLLTCCIGGILLAIPYLGTVLLLPMLVFLRALGPSFLGQFGDEFNLWKGTQLEVQS